PLPLHTHSVRRVDKQFNGVLAWLSSCTREKHASRRSRRQQASSPMAGAPPLDRDMPAAQEPDSTSNDGRTPAMHQRITPTATMIMSCLVATGLIGVAACGPPPSPEGNSTAGAEAATLTVAETTAPSTLDPQASGLFADRFAWQLSYECLMYTTPEGSVEPALASEYRVSEDGLTYSFTLREGVAF